MRRVSPIVAVFRQKTKKMMLGKVNGPRQWCAKLNIDLVLRARQTVVSNVLHDGPLRIQKSFLQPDGSCHVYLLHPPGGMVGGDQLSINISSEDFTKVLLTTPSAGKFYRCLPNLSQKQMVQISLGESAHVEWLPQENIFFDGARADIETEVYLAKDSVFLGWEIQCLGRKASGELFKGGSVTQRMRLYREGRLVHRENLEVSPPAPLMLAGWGLNANNVFGTLFASLPEERIKKTSTQIQSVISKLNTIYFAQNWGFTLKESIILGRYLGESVEECRAGLNEMRLMLDAEGVCESGSMPRIWKT